MQCFAGDAGSSSRHSAHASAAELAVHSHYCSDMFAQMDGCATAASDIRQLLVPTTHSQERLHTIVEVLNGLVPAPCSCLCGLCTASLIIQAHVLHCQSKHAIVSKRLCQSCPRWPVAGSEAKQKQPLPAPPRYWNSNSSFACTALDIAQCQKLSPHYALSKRPVERV